MLNIRPNSLEKSLVLDRREIEDLLERWILEKFDTSDPRWQKIVARVRRKMRRKLIKFQLLGSLPTTPAFSRYRTEQFVKQQYGSTWSNLAWPDDKAPVGKNSGVPADWRGNGYLFRRGTVSRLGLAMFVRTIEMIKPKRVLEVGAGWGLNLFVLSAMFPEIEFTGVELTRIGVARCKSVQELDALPDPLVRYCLSDNIDRKAFKRIRFTQGDAAALDFSDEDFDLVLSAAAIEQMENIKDVALSEIRRVTKSHLAMYEPFADFNEDPLRRLSIRAKNFITLPVSGLRAHNIAPIYVFSDWPHKLTAGTGFVLAKAV